MITTTGTPPNNAKDNSVDPVVCELGAGCADVEMVGSWDLTTKNPILYYNQPFDYPHTIQDLFLERSTDQSNWTLIADTTGGAPHSLPSPNTTIPLAYSYTDTDITILVGQTYYYRLTGTGFGGTFQYNVISLNLSQDIQNPRVQIVAPYNGATVSGSIPVIVNAEDDINLARVDIYVDDRGMNVLVGSIPLFGVNNSGSLTIDTTLYTNGGHNIIAVPFDAAGNRGNYGLVGLTISNNAADSGLPILAMDAGHAPFDPGGTGSCEIMDVKFDSAGNMNVVGFYSVTVIVGGTPITSRARLLDIFVAQFSPLGVLNWVFSYGSPYDDKATSLAIDSHDNLFVTGQFRNKINFGGADLIAGDTNNVQPDLYIVKFNNAGGHLWSKNLGSKFTTQGNAICVDVSDNIYVAGSVNLQADFGGGLRTNQGYNGFVAKYLGSDGTWIWDVVFKGAGSYNFASQVVVDPPGHVFVIGSCLSGNVDLGGGNLTTFGYQFGFVASYDSNFGTYLWGRSLAADKSNIGGAACALDGSYNLFVSGNYTKGFYIDTIYFADIGLYCYVAKLNPATGVAVAGFTAAPDNFSTLAGSIPSSIKIDSTGMIVMSFTTAQGTLVIMKYTPTQLLQWSYQYGATGQHGNTSHAVALNAARKIAFVGLFYNSITVTGFPPLQASGGQDGFLIEYNP